METIRKTVRVYDAEGNACVAYQDTTPIMPILVKWMDRFCAFSFWLVIAVIVFSVLSANQMI